MITGGIAGLMAGNQDPANAATAGARARATAVTALRAYFLVGAALLAVAGTWAGILPGTGTRPPATDE